VSASWVAGTVRAKGMARRVIGTDAARQLAACQSLSQAQQMLAATPYRAAAEPGLSLPLAQHAVAATILWDLRVLAGWLPPDGVSLLRLLAGWFEIANVDELLQAFAGRPVGAEFQLGALATAWPRLSEASSEAELRHALAASAWGDPGGDTGHDIRLGMRLRWAARVMAYGDWARRWAQAGAELLRPEERSETENAASGAGPGTAADRPVAAPARSAGVRGGSPSVAAEAQAGPAPESWQAEADWWRQVESGGRMLVGTAGPDSGPVLGAVAVMAADARRVCAALETAARGGIALEAYDAVA